LMGGAGAAAAVVIIRRRRASKERASKPAQFSRARYQPVTEAEKARFAVQRREKERLRKVKEILARYDKNGSKFLERAELLELLTDIDSSTPVGTTPSDEEVDFVMKVADVSGDGRINAKELDIAIVCFGTFTDQREVFETAMKKYDLTHTGNLSREEVKAYLVDLSGSQVADDEVDMVMKGADVMHDGVINKMELQRATALWYGYIEEQNTKKSKSCVLL